MKPKWKKGQAVHVVCAIPGWTPTLEEGTVSLVKRKEFQVTTATTLLEFDKETGRGLPFGNHAAFTGLEDAKTHHAKFTALEAFHAAEKKLHDRIRDRMLSIPAAIRLEALEALAASAEILAASRRKAWARTLARRKSK